jgi:tetratricopeptide (TPR) repeat protein
VSNSIDETAMKPTESPALRPIIQELGTALRSAQGRSQKWRAWQMLAPMDERGIRTLIPYTPEAIALMESAYEAGDGDCDLIHHLAIAYHAWAWDLEREGVETAVNAWTKSLFYWRKLQTCADFWQTLSQRGEAIAGSFDAQRVATFRRDLLGYLLEIHVEFIRHYYEQQQYDRALRHIELIRQARIPPAMRKELTALVYEAMTAAVPDAKLNGRFPEALAVMDGFLRLFPTYIPALQLYLEIIAEWTERLSPAEQWPELSALSEQAWARWEMLYTSQELKQHPFAQSTLNNLATLMGKKHWARAIALQSKRNPHGQPPRSLVDEEYEAYQHTITWLNRLDFSTYAHPEACQTLYYALLSQAQFMAYVFLTTNNDHLITGALESCMAAMKVSSENNNARQLAAQILHLRVEKQLAELSGLSAADLRYSLKNMEQDIEKALEYAPEDNELREKLTRIREFWQT